MRSSLAPLLLLLLANPGAAADRPFGLEDRPRPAARLRFPAGGGGAPPPLLSHTGAFRDTRMLAPDPALVPYDLNVPFWSDGAAKRRWISVPDVEGERAASIRVGSDGAWTFPAGTVFVKHFELPADEARPDVTRRLETRLLAVDAKGGVAGASYRWREDGSDADLVTEPRIEPIAVRTASGARVQRWYFPGPADCVQCHTPASGGVLGVTARQLHGDYAYPSGVTDNQLRTWSHLGLLDPLYSDADLARLPRLARLDNPDASIEDRARSYLDANCAHCHRPGGAAADFDARYETPLIRQRLIGEPARINFGVDGARFVAPNDPWRSMVLTRVETLEPTKMPPLAHEEVDRRGAELLRAWIASLPGPPVLAPPEIRPKGGDLRGAVRVSIGHDDPNAVVRFTLDGSPPGKSSPEYTAPFEVRRSTTVRARAYRPGHTRSIAVQETFIIDSGD